VKGWYARRRAGNYGADRKTLTNLPGACFVFPGGTTRAIAEEVYDVIARTEQTFSFGPDGTEVEDDRKEFAWDATKGRCDVFPQSVTDSPPDPTDPTAPFFQPSLVGPTGYSGGNQAIFQASATGIPTGIIASAIVRTILAVSPGGWVFNGTTYDWVSSGPAYEVTTDFPGAFFVWLEAEAIADIAAPGGTVWTSQAKTIVLVTDDNGVEYTSPPVYFDAAQALRGGQFNYP
jgi:hypothetical protein